MNTILIVDDNNVNRMILVNGLKEEYETMEAENGKIALDIIEEKKTAIACVLLDIRMPEMDGITVLQKLQANKLSRLIPIILITGDKTEELETKCYELGAADFVTKPFDLQTVRYIIKNSIEMYSEKNQWQRISLIQNRKLKEQTEKLRKENEGIIEAIGVIAEYKGLDTSNHVQRVREISVMLAAMLGNLYPEYKITLAEALKIGSASCLHDIGKILIPDEIILKPGRLDRVEMEVMKSHTTKGCELIQMIGRFLTDDYQKYCYDICRSHHERYDGEGYPDHLVGDNIPISAQVVSVVESFDSLISDTVFRKAIPFDVAFEMILNGECGMFSPKLLDCFKKAKSEIFKIITK